MGAWHPLLNLSGCPGTRGTRSNKGPVSLKQASIWISFLISSDLGRENEREHLSQGQPNQNSVLTGAWASLKEVFCTHLEILSIPPRRCHQKSRMSLEIYGLKALASHNV